MEIPNPSSLILSLKPLQLTMFQKIQSLLPELLQETSQDGDQDTQSSQLQFYHQSTGLFHPPTDLLPDLLPLLTETLNLSLHPELPQIIQFSKVI